MVVKRKPRADRDSAKGKADDTGDEAKCLGAILPNPILLSNSDPLAEEGLYHGDGDDAELHALTCPCQPCATENETLNQRRAEQHVELTPEEWEQWWETLSAQRIEWAAKLEAGEDDAAWEIWVEALKEANRLEMRLNIPDYLSLVNAMQGADGPVRRAAIAYYRDETLWDAFEGARADTIAIESFKHTLPLVAGDAVKIPALLTRSDGETLLYEGRLNSLFGEPGLGKSWVALMAVIEVVKNGSRVVWWDFEDRPGTLAARLTALGAANLIDSDSLIYATPDLADDPTEMAAMCMWLARGDRPGFVVIDSVESAGLATDSNNAGPWYDKHADPWLNAGVGVLTLDHIPKRVQDRPRGAIGSQHKMARISGAGLLLTGTPWTKTQGGKVKLVNHKDRQGDLPAPINKTVAIIEVTHGEDGLLLYSINAPEAEENTEDVTYLLLEAIAAAGPQGVRTKKGIRGLLKAGHRKVDPALDDLLNQGLVSIGKDGQTNIYVVTPDGQAMLDVGLES